MELGIAGDVIGGFGVGSGRFVDVLLGGFLVPLE